MSLQITAGCFAWGGCDWLGVAIRNSNPKQQIIIVRSRLLHWVVVCDLLGITSDMCLTKLNIRIRYSLKLHPYNYAVSIWLLELILRKILTTPYNVKFDVKQADFSRFWGASREGAISNILTSWIIYKICHSLIKWQKPSCISTGAVYLKCKTAEICFGLLFPFYNFPILILHIECLYKVG